MEGHALSEVANVSDRILFSIVHHIIGGEYLLGSWACSIPLEKGELEIWYRAFQIVFCPPRIRLTCFVDTGVFDQSPFDPFLELLTRCFLPSELLPLSKSKEEESMLWTDKEWLGLLLVFYLWEHSGLCDSYALFFNFLLRLCTWHFKATTVSISTSLIVRSVDDMLLFASAILALEWPLVFYFDGPKAAGPSTLPYLWSYLHFSKELSRSWPFGPSVIVMRRDFGFQIFHDFLSIPIIYGDFFYLIFHFLEVLFLKKYFPTDSANCGGSFRTTINFLK